MYLCIYIVKNSVCIRMYSVENVYQIIVIYLEALCARIPYEGCVFAYCMKTNVRLYVYIHMCAHVFVCVCVCINMRTDVYTLANIAYILCV